MENIIISGSMNFLQDMQALILPLEQIGYNAIVPEEDDWDSIPKEKINDYKKLVSMKHMSAIADNNTKGILVVNNPKRGVNNYIGANTFAEIAIAFYFGKNIYLLNDIYAPYEDELLGWGVTVLNGDLSKI